MAKFKYSMENILRVKERVEEQKRMALGRAMADYQNTIAEQKTIEVKLQIYLDEFYGSQRMKTNASALQQMSSQVSWYEDRLKMQKDVVARALDIVELKRTELRKALEEKKIQEKLRENAFEQYKEEEKIKEQHILDEIVGYRYASGVRDE